MPVVSVVNPKGGAGKSTIATNLAARLARDYLNHVKLIDADFEQHSSHDWAGRREDEGVIPPIVRGLARGKTYPAIVAESGAWQWVVVDTPGADCPETRGALGAADFIVVPFGVSQFDMDAFGLMVQIIKDMRDSGTNTPMLAVLNDVDVKCTREAREALDGMGKIGEALDFAVHPDVLWTRQIVRMATREGKAVHEMVGGRASEASAEFETLYISTLRGVGNARA